ncbi:MAG: chorismate lyase [Pseudomonadales bacterium]|nr:chorismate lyase [Pseudomonadales bacterium]
MLHSRAPMALLHHDSAVDLALGGPADLSQLIPDALFARRSAPALRTWMLHDGSLTDRLARAHGPVRVTPTREGVGAARPFEARLLGAPDRGGWWIREITLAAGATPRLRARTLVPPASRDLQRRLRGLGATPLGRVLFRGDRLRPEVRRGPRAFGRNAMGAWLRVTSYAVRGEALLVIERLLDAAWQTPDAGAAAER